MTSACSELTRGAIAEGMNLLGVAGNSTIRHLRYMYLEYLTRRIALSIRCFRPRTADFARSLLPIRISRKPCSSTALRTLPSLASDTDSDCTLQNLDGQLPDLHAPVRFSAPRGFLTSTLALDVLGIWTYFTNGHHLGLRVLESSRCNRWPRLADTHLLDLDS